MFSLNFTFKTCLIQFSTLQCAPCNPNLLMYGYVRYSKSLIDYVEIMHK